MNLKEFRESLNLSQIEMAKKIGVSKSYYSKVESGFRNPSYAFLVKIKNKFPNINIDNLFFKEKI